MQKAVGVIWKVDIEDEPFSEFALWGEKVEQDFKTGEVSDGAPCNDREHFALKGREERE